MGATALSGLFVEMCVLRVFGFRFGSSNTFPAVDEDPEGLSPLAEAVHLPTSMVPAQTGDLAVRGALTRSATPVSGSQFSSASNQGGGYPFEVDAWSKVVLSKTSTEKLTAVWEGKQG